jgi:hypothetical protein
MTHYVIEGGPFDLAFRRMPAAWFLPFTCGEAAAATGKAKPTAKASSKSRYTCPSCSAHIWGKPGLEVVCVPCQAMFRTGREAEREEAKAA